MAILTTGREVDVPQLVKPSDRSDRLYWFYVGDPPGEVVAYDSSGDVVGRRRVPPMP